MRATELIQESLDKARSKGRTLESDREIHFDGELGQAALGYLDAAVGEIVGYAADSPPWNWPWAPLDWKPGDSALENLVKAGALIAAEVERLHAEALDVIGNPDDKES